MASKRHLCSKVFFTVLFIQNISKTVNERAGYPKSASGILRSVSCELCAASSSLSLAVVV